MKRLALVLALIVPAGAAGADAPAVLWKVGPAPGGGGRVLFAPDPLLLSVARDPTFLPNLPETVAEAEGGKVAHPLLDNGWACRTILSETERTVLLSGRGFQSVFVNGERRPGDVYRDGLLLLPVRLRAGENRILVRALRGDFTFSLSPAEGDASLSPHDATLPDFRAGERVSEPGAVIVLNHLDVPFEGAILEVGDGRIVERAMVPVEPVLPGGIAKPPFPIRQLRDPDPNELDPQGRYALPVVLRRGALAYAAVYPVEVRAAGEAYRQTRLSGIDGSVQYHAVRPPVRVEPGRSYALYLSLHGAGVEAIGQARAYEPKRDAFVVAPTNRRRFGFDWQDWGRLDALEALDYATKHYPIDPDRVYLTGHSMGGHGTWYLGSLFASRFAAIAPSAGWASFFTYAGGMPRTFGSDPDLAPFAAAQRINDTEAFLGNLAMTPVYVLHGEMDDNVPLRESENLVAKLRTFHHDFDFHVQPGAGHWWGNECVDYDPLFEFCRRHVRVRAPLSVRFATPDPEVSGTAAWVEIVARIDASGLSRVEADADPRKGEVAVRTANVAALALSLAGVLPQETAKVDVDGTAFEAKTAEGLLIARGEDGTWRRGDPAAKGGGPFRMAFGNRMVFVYGTAGTPEENAANLAQARCDAETWWVRGNGNVTTLPDRDFSATRYRGRNVILYGNADTNAAYAGLLPDCPVRVARGKVTVGDRVYEDDLGLYLCYPRPAGGGMVAIVGATSAAATRTLAQARYFTSGCVAPDWVVFSEDTLLRGMEGVAASGFFTNDWRLR